MLVNTLYVFLLQEDRLTVKEGLKYRHNPLISEQWLSSFCGDTSPQIEIQEWQLLPNFK